jgi:hypothetical protein
VVALDTGPREMAGAGRSRGRGHPHCFICR